MMTIEKKIKDILGLTQDDYIRGVAEAPATLDTIMQLQEAHLIELGDGMEDAPTTRDFCKFIKKHADRDIELRLLVVSPDRDDFRIVVKSVVFDPEYAKLNTEEDMMFWKDFMDLGRDTDAEMVDTNLHVGWTW